MFGKMNLQSRIKVLLFWKVICFSSLFEQISCTSFRHRYTRASNIVLGENVPTNTSLGSLTTSECLSVCSLYATCEAAVAHPYTGVCMLKSKARLTNVDTTTDAVVFTSDVSTFCS